MLISIYFSVLTIVYVWRCPALCGGFTSHIAYAPNYQQALRIQTYTTVKAADKDNAEGDFSFAQKVDSVKSGLVGALAGGVALAPVSALHDIALGDDTVANGVAQWEFDTDMGSLEAALFAIVYRYCIRDDSNPMLNQGVVGAFVLVRTLSKVQVPLYCTAVPLNCGPPIGYLDFAMLFQICLSGLESAALFGAAAAAMDFCISRRFISTFRA